MALFVCLVVVTVLIGVAVVAVWDRFVLKSASTTRVVQKPLFYNAYVTHPESGKSGWFVPDIVHMEGNFVAYDADENIVVIGLSPKFPGLTLPVRQNGGDVVSLTPKGGRVIIPIVKNTLLVYDSLGVVRTSPLGTRRAKDVFQLFKDNPSLDVPKLCSQLEDNSLPIP